MANIRFLDQVPVSAYTVNNIDTTYDLASVQSGLNVDINLSGSDASLDIVSLIAGTNITLTDDGSSNVTIDANGLGGTQYVFVSANGTDVENAAELQAAYTTAQGMSPSVSNRITVIAAPANYNFAANFVMSTQFIDLISLDGNRSIIFNGTATISVTANDVFIKGVDVTTKNFTIATNLNLLKVENCTGGDFSFGLEETVSGTFTNCVGGDESFGSSGTASGTFKDCVGGVGSFGGQGTASGTFTNCVGGNFAFGGFAGGGGGGTASGTFTNCQGGVESFGGSGTVSGTFTNCVGDDFSFGGDGGTASGTFTNCQGGVESFGGGGTASGTFTNCVGGNFAFGFGGTGVSGAAFFCKSGGSLTVSGAGVIRLSLDGANSVIILG